MTRPLRERPDRPQTPPPPRPAPRDRAPRPRDRQHTPAPGARPGTARQRLLRQRLVVFVTVTIGVALAIAAAQGCENRDNQSVRPPTGVVANAGSGGEQAAPGTSADVAPQTSTAPLPAAARTGTDSGLTAPQAPVPTVDWPNRSYPDGAGGPAIALQNGHSVGAGPQVALSAVLPARYKGLPASVVVLRRAEGSAPVDLVQLYTFTGDTPVATASRTSAADPQATATWRLDGSTVVREERAAATGAVSSTRYTVRTDGTLDESWPGATTPPPAAAPAPPTSPTG
ncbi:hypothetical protein AB0E96_34330 [Kitasatospora sp. NPDC036755]|uniref:hypothetical protein n=1 Tax=Kitasatospora sp. NPDC036755 TaxID=3154600 RepID=UPI0033FF8744